jgi:hypothetical protein
MRELLALLIPACAIGACLSRSAGLPSARAAVASLALAMCLGIGFSSVVSIGLIVIGIAPTSRAFVLADVALWVIVGALGLFTRRAAESPEPKAQSREPRAQSRKPHEIPLVLRLRHRLLAALVAGREDHVQRHQRL